MKVLVAVLNWGLGHATRSVPLIRQQIADGNEVILASDGYPLTFLQQEFPRLKSYELPSYNIRYGKGNSQVWAMTRNIPRIIKAAYKEHRYLKKLVENEKIELIISDNRFGMWHKKVHSVYITHQILIKMPRGLKCLEPFGRFLHRKIIHRYTECRIPDNKGGNSLAGDLTQTLPHPENARFIGPLSRFKDTKTIDKNEQFQNVCILSGIEPQRSIFEEQLMTRFNQLPQATLIVQGKPQAEKKSYQVNKVEVVSHLSTEEMLPLLLGAKKIIARSGYSTIMDLEAIGCLHKAELIPTPGQPEQEYLAMYLQKKSTPFKD